MEAILNCMQSIIVDNNCNLWSPRFQLLAKDTIDGDDQLFGIVLREVN